MMVTAFMRAFWAVSDSRSVTSDSRSRLPNISMPTRGVALGRRRTHSRSVTIGKRMRSVLETSRSCLISMRRSSLVVSARMIGGWMIGTSAM